MTQLTLFGIVLGLLLQCHFAFSQIVPTWDMNVAVDPHGENNPYQLSNEELNLSIKRGQIYAQQYPVQTTGMLLPAKPTLKLLDLEPGEGGFSILKFFLRFTRPFDKTFKGFWNWVGLNNLPEIGVALPEGQASKYPFGVSFIKRNGTTGVTMGCVACHSSPLFGKTVFGLTNRFSRADEFFLIAKKALPHIGANALRLLGANRAERDLYRELRRNFNSISLKKPEALGLDTSLSVVARSLALRAEDPWATKGKEYYTHARNTYLDNHIADSKPAVWWNTKYKNRWLSDGSVISGNPILTNILWNEIGRGSELKDLDQWTDENQTVIMDLTNAVFNAQAPRWSEFFEKKPISLEKAKKGETIFNQNCAHCHGTYLKAWSLDEVKLQEWLLGGDKRSFVDTIQVKYHEKTPVKNVGTDSSRRLGVIAIENGVNPLEYAKKHKIVNQVQEGYVPPPLVGIWSRYPYFHNNAIPNLCELMTPPEKRVQGYYSGMAINIELDYDHDCLGYPIQEKTPASWKVPLHFFDHSKKGLSNEGHYEKIFRKNGIERYSEDEKRDLREFLKTL